MKSLIIADPVAAVLTLKDEVRRSQESRYDQRLHGVMLVAQGMACPEVGRLLGVAPRTVEYWVRHFEECGLAGLAEKKRCGRRKRLNEMQLQEVKALVQHASSGAGASQMPLDGKGLRVLLARRFGIELGDRQCQRILRQFGFRRVNPAR